MSFFQVCDEIKDEIETKSFANYPYSLAIITKNTIISLDGKPSPIFLVKSHDTFIFL